MTRTEWLELMKMEIEELELLLGRSLPRGYEDVHPYMWDELADATNQHIANEMRDKFHKLDLLEPLED